VSSISGEAEGQWKWPQLLNHSRPQQ
jgi:hypothetical protein